MSIAATCPFSDSADDRALARHTTNADWWPNQLDLKLLNQHSPLINPMAEDFNYAK